MGVSRGVGKMIQNLKLIRSDRRTISLEITSAGQVIVRAPRRMSEAEIKRFSEVLGAGGESFAWLQKTA